MFWHISSLFVSNTEQNSLDIVLLKKVSLTEHSRKRELNIVLRWSGIFYSRLSDNILDYAQGWSVQFVEHNPSETFHWLVVMFDLVQVEHPIVWLPNFEFQIYNICVSSQRKII